MGRSKESHSPASMKLLCAYAMCSLGGVEQPSTADVKKVLEAAGYDMTDEDSTKLEEFVEEMAGQNIYDVIGQGLEKVATANFGGGGGGGGAAADGAAEEAPKEEEKKESSSESEGGMCGGGMFDDDY